MQVCTHYQAHRVVSLGDPGIMDCAFGDLDWTGDGPAQFYDHQFKEFCTSLKPLHMLNPLVRLEQGLLVEFSLSGNSQKLGGLKL